MLFKGGGHNGGGGGGVGGGGGGSSFLLSGTIILDEQDVNNGDGYVIVYHKAYQAELNKPGTMKLVNV